MKKVLGLILAAMLMFVACGGGGDTEPAVNDGAQEAVDEPTDDEVSDATDVAGESELEMEIGDFFFAPATLQGEAGQELTLMLENTGDAAHTFTIEDQDIDEELQGGDAAEATVTFPDSGSVEFICRFHVGGGMAGTLEVAG